MLLIPIRCIFIAIICNLVRVGRVRMGKASFCGENRGGYSLPLTDFNAVGGVGFANVRTLPYLCTRKRILRTGEHSITHADTFLPQRLASVNIYTKCSLNTDNKKQNLPHTSPGEHPNSSLKHLEK